MIKNPSYIIDMMQTYSDLCKSSQAAMREYERLEQDLKDIEKKLYEYVTNPSNGIKPEMI